MSDTFCDIVKTDWWLAWAEWYGRKGWYPRANVSYCQLPIDRW